MPKSISAATIRLSSVAMASLVLLAAAGCSVSNAPATSASTSSTTSSGGSTTGTSPSAPSAVGPIHGLVHGGQQPLVGSTVNLYVAGTSGYGTGATMIGTATSDANGNFQFVTSPTGPNQGQGVSSTNCPAGSQAYITASGGYESSVNTISNTAILLMDVLGSCSNLSTSSSVLINELTTVAAGYALSGFTTTSCTGSPAVCTANVGAPAANSSTAGSATPNAPAGLAHAFMNASNLVNSGIGQANTKISASPGITGLVPFYEVNTLGNAMAACVNSASGSSTACMNLMTATPSISGVAPTNTLQSMIYLARNPASAAAMSTTAGVYNVATGFSAFPNTLTTAPSTDWTLSVVYSGGGLGTGWWLTLDKNDTVYTSLASYTADADIPILFGLSPYGSAVPTFANNPNYGSTNDTNTTARGIAADGLGNVWVANGTTNGAYTSAYQFNTTSGAFNLGFGDGHTYSLALAVDASNNLWISHANGAGNVVEGLYAPGTNPPTTATWTATDTASVLASVSTIAIDANQNVWLAPYQAQTGGNNTSLFMLPAPYNTTATGTPVISGGAVSGVAINSPGDYLTTAPTVTFSAPPTPTTATGTDILSTVTPGTVSSVSITSVGGYYASIPTVNLDTTSVCPTTKPTGTVVLTNGVVSSVTITNPGAGCASTPVVSFSAPTALSAATGTASITGSTTGSVQSISVGTAGSGYPTAPAVTLSAPTQATATGTATVITSQLTSITVTAPGGFYATAPTITLGSGCTGTLAYTVHLNTTGGVSSVTVTSPVSCTSGTPSVTFSAPTSVGVTATATSTINASGAVTGYTIVNPGQYYIAAPTVTLVSPITAATATGTATLTATPGGVASVTVTDVGGYYINPPTITFSGTVAPLTVALPSYTTVTTAALSEPYGVSLDAMGDAWFTLVGAEDSPITDPPSGSGTHSNTGLIEAVANAATTATAIAAGSFIPNYTPTTATSAASSYEIGVTAAEESAMDGAGTLFMGDIFSNAYGIHAYSTVTGASLSPTHGLFGCTAAQTCPSSGSTTYPTYNTRGIGIDSTGSVWIDSNYTSTITQIIGIAAPAYPLLSSGHPGLSPGLTSAAPLP